MYEEIGKKLREEKAHQIKKSMHVSKDTPAEKATAKGETPDFAQAIKKLRKEGNMSLENLAEVTGINKQTLHSMENYSILNPSFSNLEKIATAFKVSLNDLLLMARGESTVNLFKTTAADRWTLSYETEKGFTVHSYAPPGVSHRDFFIGVITIQGGKKLKHWQFCAHSKACIQPWDGDVQFIYHGMNWRKDVHVLANETLYFDAEIPHSLENLSETANRILLVTHPSIF